MKRLKLRAKLSVDGKTCTIEVVEQSHTRLDFGENYHGAGSFVHGRIRLLSYSIPLFRNNPDAYDKVKVNLYVRGPFLDEGSLIENVPANLWPEIKAAVEAYNEYYSDEKIKEREEAKRKKQIEEDKELKKFRKMSQWSTLYGGSTPTWNMSYEASRTEDYREISWADIQRAADLMRRR